jgi:cyanophycin synthetase
MRTDNQITPITVNARRKDAFDLFNFNHYQGPNPYLETGATVFDFALTGFTDPLPLEVYVDAIAQYYPHLGEQSYDSYAHLFARTTAEVNCLEMELHFHRWSYQSCGQQGSRIALQALHARTSRAVIYCVWDWFEAITKQQHFPLPDQIEVLQGLFRQSVYGGPTVYALLKTAYEQDIPTFYLWDEGLMQYGYGKKQVRGIATTFNVDSHLDSDFTTRKDDCKAFLNTLGFPVPKGNIAYSLKEALTIADRLGYPVAVKPVVGHKGNGVTADVRTEADLEHAYDRAAAAIPPEEPIRVIIETSISGKDFRLLCVDGRFVAATERCPAYVIGDGELTIQELIERENRRTARSDTPTSPLGKIKMDDAMERYLEEQRLSLDAVLERDRRVFLRKVANLSAGGLSIDATATIHPDNIILAQDIAQHFQLTCLGIDVISQDLSQSWKDGNFGILEINAAPGIYMHLKPAIGEKVNVTSAILKTFFHSKSDARIPIITFNRITVTELEEVVDYILFQHPEWTIGAACRDTVLVNRAKKNLHPDYNTNVQNLLRNPSLDLLITEYQQDILEQNGMFYFGSNVVILDQPTEIEMALARDTFEDSTVVIKQEDVISIRHKGLMQQYTLGNQEPFSRVYLKEISTIL